jgi:DinB superfamily
MRELTGDLKDLVDAYRRGPTLLTESLRDIDAGALNTRRPGSDWSIKDNVLHLGDMEMVRSIRIRAIIAEDEPVLAPVDQDRWTRRLQYLWRSPEAALALFDHLVFANVELLRWCDRTAWDRTGQHPELGAVTVRFLVERGIAHVAEHVAEISATREALRK